MKKYTKFVLVLFCTLIIITQTACMAKGKEPVSDTVYDLLNTTCTITIYYMEEKQAQTLIGDAFDLCKDYEQKLSKTIVGSDVYNINQSGGEPVQVSAATNAVVQAGYNYGLLSEGRFDITVGKLSELWDFSGDNPHVPQQADIDVALQTVDYTKLHFSDELKSDVQESQKHQYEIWNDNKDSELDLGGIAKGYIADCVADFLIDKGVESAIVNLGGNIVTIGEKEDGSPWTVGVEKPFSGRSEVIGSVQVKNKTVVTSGIYERMFEENGTLYHHILNVKTGYPTDSDVEAVTLVGDMGKSMDCDALSTICLMLGTEKGLALIESIEGIEASFIAKDGTITSTSGMNFTPST